MSTKLTWDERAQIETQRQAIEAISDLVYLMLHDTGSDWPILWIGEMEEAQKIADTWGVPFSQTLITHIGARLREGDSSWSESETSDGDYIANEHWILSDCTYG